MLGVLHNLSKRTNNKKYFDNSSAIETLLSFFRTKFPVYRMTALLALAYLVDEKNNHLIMASEGKRSLNEVKTPSKIVKFYLSCRFVFRYQHTSSLHPMWDIKLQ